MAAVEVTISGVLYDKLARTTRPVVLIGEASLTGLGVGGGPVFPPEGGGGPPDHIWGPTDPRPTPPIAFPPGWVGGVPPGTGTWPPQNPPHPAHPIVLPPEQVPPDQQPPTTPPPGTVTPVPPPAGSAGWPVNPITPPAYVVLNYPGVGPVYVTPPAPAPASRPPAGGSPPSTEPAGRRG